jgi:hypothetical protein
MKSILYSFSFFLLFSSLYSQESEYTILSIPDSLKQNANAVVRRNQLDITIVSQRSMTIKTQRIVSVLNDKGLSSIDATENYDKTTAVNSIGAIVYNAFGKEIKKLKRKDFKDQAVIDGMTIFSDSRILYLNYTPTEYPFTIVYESEISTSNTAFIPQWMPLSDYFLSVEKSVLNVTYPDNLGFKKKEINFEGYKINKRVDSKTQLSFSIENMVVQKMEDYSSPLMVFPRVMMGLESFHLEGVDGNAKTWKEFGQWYSDKILSGTVDLPEETKLKVKTLVGDEKDPIKKAKIIYNYVQQKSRYVSIQVGIGGWKPMLAKDVDRLGYGDCKALTNYTKALLNAVDVPSCYTVLYGSSSKRSIESDFVSMQGNHVMLSIPSGDKYVWLECTSQEDPFGFQGTFTDDRNVLVIKPEGGEIVRTSLYSNNYNSQISKGEYSLLDNGDVSGAVSIVSQGTQYAQKFGVEKMSLEDREAHYKEYFDNINNLKINKVAFLNDKEKVAFTENINLGAQNYGNVSANRLLFVANIFNKYDGIVKKIRNRKNPFEISRGYFDQDEVIVSLPQGYGIEAMPNNIELKSKFGEYKITFIKKEDNTIQYIRSMLEIKGVYTNKEYDEYRLFMEQVNKNDNAKIVLIKK